MNTENNLQSNKDLKPINWCKNLSELEIQNKMKNFIEKCKCDFRIYWFRYLQQLLKKLLEETKSEVQDFIDEIRKITDFVQIRIAVKGTLTLKVNVHIYIYIIYNIYIYIGDGTGKNLNPQVTGEPILLNPNSYQNIDSILQSFKSILRIGEEREWAVLGFKGLFK